MDIFRSLSDILSELIDGAPSEPTWVLNIKDAGLLASLDRLTAEEASAIPASGGASIAAHVDHLRYGLSLANRWSHGENPFATANYGESWKRLKVSSEEWAARRDALRQEAYAWREVLKHPRELSTVELTGLLASAVHLAYHVGAIRQINRSIRGPAEEE